MKETYIKRVELPQALEEIEAPAATREVVTANASRRMSTVKEEEYVPSLMMDLWLARDRQLILECEHLSKSER